ncbi:MAG: redoxin domain-containing protein [Nitrospirae bacterium]|nr:redoxin domain-containing protein [Nitrospirota bacterium]
MKQIILLFSFLFLITPPAYAVNIPHGGTVPDFTLNALDGKVVSLGKHKGSIVIVIYWKPDHKRSLDALKDVHDILRGYKDKGVRAISLTAGGENREKIQKAVNDNGIDFPVLTDADRQVFGDYGIRVYPSTLVIDRNFKLTYEIPGHPLTYKTTLEAYLQYMLGEIDSKKLDDILSFMPEAVDEASAIAERRYNLALKFTESGLYGQAEEAVKKSIEIKPGIARPHIMLGFLFLAAKEADKAVDEFSKALQIEPASHDAKTGLGAAFILKGDITQALKILADSVDKNPCPLRAYYELGRAYELNENRWEYIKRLFRIISGDI